MSQLSAQSIRQLCTVVDWGVGNWLRHPNTGTFLPMISPFEPDKKIVNGKSYGLSSASYDLRIAHDLNLCPHPGHVLLDRLREAPAGFPSAALGALKQDTPALTAHPCFALAHTIETVAIPLKVVGYIHDKSTYARLGVSCFNTLFDPGFIGVPTLELVNLSADVVVIKAGDPICQMVFHWLDETTDRPYAGKYQFQPEEPVAAIMETTPAA